MIFLKYFSGTSIKLLYSYLLWTFFPCCRMGYEGLWKKRTNELYDEGEATFYKTSRFTVVESNTYSLADLANKVKRRKNKIKIPFT